MKIASLKTAETIPGGIRLNFVDTSGSKRVLDLSPNAESQLIVALLTAPPASPGRTPPRSPFVAEALRLMVDANGVCILEVFLNSKAAIPIVLPNTMPEQLRKLLSQGPSEWAGVTLH